MDPLPHLHDLPPATLATSLKYQIAEWADAFQLNVVCLSTTHWAHILTTLLPADLVTPGAHAFQPVA